MRLILIARVLGATTELAPLLVDLPPTEIALLPVEPDRHQPNQKQCPGPRADPRLPIQPVQLFGNGFLGAVAIIGEVVL